ncbi:MAG: ABC transporter permease [Clostridiaceae bacterium]|nr:ABC transporter permease [Clostridiaceae bacterium]
MLDTVKSTVIFLRHHMIPFIVFFLAGGALFITMLFLDFSARDTYREEDQHRSYLRAQYTFFTDDAKRSNIDSLISDITNLSKTIDRVIVSDAVIVHLRDNRTVESRLWAFSPELEEDLVIDDGAIKFANSNNTLMTAHGFEEELVMTLLGETTTDSDGYIPNTFTLNDMKPVREILGSVRINDSEPHTIISFVYSVHIPAPGLYSEFGHFFELSDSCDTVIVEFSEPLNQLEESSFLSTVARHLNVKSLNLPSTYTPETEKAYAQNSFIYRLVEIICMFCVVFLFQYLIRLRRDELRIIRMVGAPRRTILFHFFLLIIMVMISSLAVGMIALCCLFLIPTVNQWFGTITAMDVFINMLIFSALLFISTLIHIVLSGVFRKTYWEEAK